MFQFYAEKNKLVVRQREAVTSGSVNVCEARFEFSPDWDGLTKTAVFQGGGEPVSLALDDSGTCQIPQEALAKSGVHLRVGVRGACGGTVVLPTAWADCGFILKGVQVSEEDSYPPTQELWKKALAGKADRLAYTDGGELGLYSGDDLLSAVPVQGCDHQFGHGLKQDGTAVAVDTVDDFSGDNTLPMTAAGVQAVIGDIEALLKAI